MDQPNEVLSVPQQSLLRNVSNVLTYRKDRMRRMVELQVMFTYISKL